MQALDLELQGGELVEQGVQAGVLAIGGLLDDRGGHPLEVAQRVALVLGRELTLEVLARLRQHLGDQRLDAVLDGLRASVGEVALQRLGQMARVGREHLVQPALQGLGRRPGPLGELVAQLAGRLVHLGLDGLRVRAGLLAVEDAGADRDRVERELHGVLAGVLALAHEAQGGLVVDDEAVDGDAVTDRAHAGLAKWGRGFHVPPVGG